MLVEVVAVLHLELRELAVLVEVALVQYQEMLHQELPTLAVAVVVMVLLGQAELAVVVSLFYLYQLLDTQAQPQVAQQ